MAKFSNPPLEIVIFKIWWHNSMQEKSKSKIGIGKFLESIMDDYLNSDNEINFLNNFQNEITLFEEKNLNTFQKLLPQNSNEFNHFLFFSDNEINIVTDDKNYSWDKLKSKIDFIAPKLIRGFSENLNPNHYHVSFDYIDFFDIGLLNNGNSLLNENFTLNFQDTRYFTDRKIRELFLAFNLSAPLNQANLQIKLFKSNENNKNGYYLHIKCDSNIVDSNETEILKWAEMGHQECQDVFLSLINKSILEKIK